MKNIIKLLILFLSVILTSCLPKDDLYIGKTSVYFGKYAVNYVDKESYPSVKVTDERKSHSKLIGKKIYGENEINIISHEKLSQIIKKSIEDFYVNRSKATPRGVVVKIEEFNYVSKRGFPLSETSGNITLTLRVGYNQIHKIGSSIESKHIVISSRADDKKNISSLIKKALQQL